jgi:hypothetical protein
MQYLNICQYCFTAHKEDLSQGNSTGIMKRNCVLLTKDELKGLMLNKLTSRQTPNGKTKFTEWLKLNRATVGERYTSELDRHFRWRHSS